MRGHAPGNVDPNRRNLGFGIAGVEPGLRLGRTDDSFHARSVWSRPYPCQPCYTLRRNAKVSAGADQNFFQPAHILDYTQHLSLTINRSKTTQIKDRITDELSRS